VVILLKSLPHHGKNHGRNGWILQKHVTPETKLNMLYMNVVEKFDEKKAWKCWSENSGITILT
jgi:hypothetical protein